MRKSEISFCDATHSRVGDNGGGVGHLAELGRQTTTTLQTPQRGKTSRTKVRNVRYEMKYNACHRADTDDLHKLNSLER